MSKFAVYTQDSAPEADVDAFLTASYTRDMPRYAALCRAMPRPRSA